LNGSLVGGNGNGNFMNSKTRKTRPKTAHVSKGVKDNEFKRLLKK
jgi:hypothetical protein